MGPLFRVTEQYSNYLVPVPTAGPGVCSVCWSCVDGWSRCHPCYLHQKQYGGLLADVVVPVALAMDSDQFADELRNYKNSPSAAVRRQLQQNLSAVLAQFLHEHERCLETAAGVPSFDLVVAVPSTQGRTDHPLNAMLSTRVGRTRARLGTPLKANAEQPGSRAVTPSRFGCADDLAGRRILLVDDTWTTGARIQSASVCLKQAGAAHVAALVLGRWLRGTYAPARTFLENAKAQAFDWDRCCLGQSGRGRCT
ncbi:ComF family protein [Crossiella sp. CA198]|uniref:ComF family protein n=1 Tax=Crossiella sp. CA198 TaxID=3455607 RepID=UPI003F8D2FA5